MDFSYSKNFSTHPPNYTFTFFSLVELHDQEWNSTYGFAGYYHKEVTVRDPEFPRTNRNATITTNYDQQASGAVQVDYTSSCPLASERLGLDPRPKALPGNVTLRLTSDFTAVAFCPTSMVSKFEKQNDITHLSTVNLDEKDYYQRYLECQARGFVWAATEPPLYQDSTQTTPATLAKSLLANVAIPSNLILASKVPFPFLTLSILKKDK